MARGLGNNAKEHESRLYTLFLYEPTTWKYEIIGLILAASEHRYK